MSRAHRFFLTATKLAPNTQIDLAEIHHQLQVVLRLEAGEQIILLDGEGRAFQAEIISLTRKTALGHLLVELPAPVEPAIDLTLYQCTLKADKFEWVLQKGTELGVSRFVPVISQRTIVRPAAAVLKKYERWQAILREAAEQCERGRIPTLAPPLDWSAAIMQAQGRRLLAWEEATTAAVTIKQALHDDTNETLLPKRINLLIGPEGGLAAEEVAEALTAGWQTVCLGPRILRAETAALTSVVLTMTHLHQF
ncbi:MAG: 16S rRNA (uracil(1498)-N(3))-methyltransferase [Caldilinea sp. CFX5]|nr:16S rRNA (uracil(1498)-N(3))-methyltransferase [Caldilinea sp. CFX5]